MKKYITRGKKIARSVARKAKRKIRISLAPDPLISVIVPVYNNSQYLRECFESVLNQTYSNFELVLVDDKSSEHEVKEILSEYEAKGLDNLRIFYNPYNQGISETLNRAIEKASGEYIAFLDCDDFLPENALERVAEEIKVQPWVCYFYTNRKHVNEKSVVIGGENFSCRDHNNVKDDLLNGMFTTHLKVVKKVAFLNIGLNEKRFDTAQDYDMSLKLAEKFPTMFIGEELYCHRIHSSQQTQVQNERQTRLAEEIKNAAKRRRKIYAGEGVPLTSIVVISFERLDDIKRCIDSIYRFTRLPFELIILDNGSSKEVKDFLKGVKKEKGKQVMVIFEKVNLGCGGGRRKAIEQAKGDFVVTLDNDMEVTKDWLEELILRITEDKNIMGVCCKSLFSNCQVEFNGSYIEEINGKLMSFKLYQNGYSMMDLRTTKRIECDWIPGGATMIRREALKIAKLDTDFINAFEDNDFSLQIKEAGYRLVNCPLAIVVHHHIMLNDNKEKEERYLKARFNTKNIFESYRSFYRKWDKLLNNMLVMKYLNIEEGPTMLNELNKSVEAENVETSRSR